MKGLLLSIRTASLGFLLLLTLAGCGYSLQNTKTNSLRDAGVEKVYVSPVKNLTYKPGVENLFYNEMTQILLAGKRVKLVDRPEISDAILEATVTSANYSPTASTSAASIFPTTIEAVEGFTVATEYQAGVACSFRLSRQKNGFPSETIWDSSFSRSRRFAGNNQKIEFGTTAALINESEFDRALREVAHGMMLDVHEAMVARF